MHSLAAVLTGLCDYPRLIEECLVDSGTVEASGAYLTQIQLRGVCKQFLVDDCVPITSAGDALFLRPAILDRNSDQIDLWPQIIAKSLAKGMINYERICKQTVSNFLRDLGKFPVRDMKIRTVEWDTIRMSFQRQYLFIGIANQKFLKDFCKGLHGKFLFNFF